MTGEVHSQDSLNFCFGYLPLAVHPGFGDMACSQHLDCYLSGLQRKACGGQKTGERSLEDGYHVLLNSVDRKKQLVKWLVAYPRVVISDTSGPAL